MASNTSTTHRPVLAAAIRAAGEPLRALVAELEPKDVPLSWAPDVLAAFVEVQRIVESGRVLMTARAAEAGQWQRDRFASPGDWLAAMQGTSTGRARADLETSERLEGLDATAGAVRGGALSPEQAGAVADAAAVNPDAEQDLLDRAQRDSLRRTRQEAERRKAEVRTEEEKAERERRVRKERSVRFWFGNGAGNMEVHGPIADLKALEQQIQREVDAQFRLSRPPAERGSRANYAFDALMRFGATCGTAGSAGSAGSAEQRTETARASRSGRTPPTRLTLVRVDLSALIRGRTEPGELCEIGGLCVSVSELRRLLGESVMQLVLTNGEAVIDVVHLGRKPTVAQMVAKLFSDSTCAVLGCDRAVRLEFDHREDWVRVMVTELANLDLLCDHHHQLKTYENWALVEGAGRRAMVPPAAAGHPRRPTGPNVGRARAHYASSDASPAGIDGSSTPDLAGARTGDLTARLGRIKRRIAEGTARAHGQECLFDTG